MTRLTQQAVNDRATVASQALASLLKAHGGRVMNMTDGGNALTCELCIPFNSSSDLMADIVMLVESAYQLGREQAREPD